MTVRVTGGASAGGIAGVAGGTMTSRAGVAVPGVLVMASGAAEMSFAGVGSIAGVPFRVAFGMAATLRGRGPVGGGEEYGARASTTAVSSGGAMSVDTGAAATCTVPVGVPTLARSCAIKSAHE